VTPQRILIVEDDARIADLISKNLTAADYECHQSPDGGRALADFARLRPALLVLDLGLQGMDGLEVTRHIRKESDVPILIVTARSSEGDKLLGLEIGADDYITKPFSTAELVARVRALLRRSTGTVTERVLEIGALRVDPARRTLERDGALVPLTTLEFDLLYFLASRAGRARAFEVTTSGHWYEAEQFERWNIINRVLPFDTLQAEAEAFAAKWSTGPTRAYEGVKTLLRAWDRHGVAGADKITIATVAPIMASDDAKAAIKAHSTRDEGRAKLTFFGR